MEPGSPTLMPLFRNQAIRARGELATLGKMLSDHSRDGASSETFGMCHFLRLAGDLITQSLHIKVEWPEAGVQSKTFAEVTFTERILEIIDVCGIAMFARDIDASHLSSDTLLEDHPVVVTFTKLDATHDSTFTLLVTRAAYLIRDAYMDIESPEDLYDRSIGDLVDMGW